MNVKGPAPIPRSFNTNSADIIDWDEDEEKTDPGIGPHTTQGRLPNAFVGWKDICYLCSKNRGAIGESGVAICHACIISHFEQEDSVLK